MEGEDSMEDSEGIVEGLEGSVVTMEVSAIIIFFELFSQYILSEIV
jgi:hypothetical protein